MLEFKRESKQIIRVSRADKFIASLRFDEKGGTWKVNSIHSSNVETDDLRHIADWLDGLNARDAL